MRSTPARSGVAVRLLGQVILAVGLGLIPTPRPAALVACAALGLLVGILSELGRRRAALDVLVPVAASVLVSVIVFGLTAAGLVVAPLLLVIPPLATLLPGGMLTTAMIELADGAPTSGASRLIAGSTRVLLLVFGIATGEVLVGVPAAQAFSQRADNLIGWWAPWLGPLVFTIGIYL